ncbi:ankyrin repeat [Fusarium coicis]|nr:ankyrin repeat [Fusarium coicis]
MNVPDYDGWTPLHWACRVDQYEQVHHLINLTKSKDDINAATKDGWTPKNIAVFHDAEYVLETLRHANTSDTEGESGLEDEASESSGSWTVGMCQPGFTCDGCFQATIYGIRWHCKKCEDFDYCFKCYWTVNKTHFGKDHEFEKLGDGPETKPIWTNGDVSEQEEEE